MKHGTKRKGFTLVELLIVIVVIGILSAMMMLSSTEAVTSAKASNIVSNFRNLKTAALALYADSFDVFSTGTTSPDMKTVFKYLGSGQAIPDSGDYTIPKTGSGWYLKYTIKGTAQEVAQIKNKLKGRASSVGLLSAGSKGDGSDGVYAGGNDVYYFVR